MPHKPRPPDRKRKLTRTVRDRQRIFLQKFAAIGVLTSSAAAAGLSLKTLDQWLQRDQDFREGFNEAKLRFHDHLEETIVNRITGVDQRNNDVLLRFKVQGELPEKYGRPGQKPKEKDHECMPDHQCLTWADIERAAREEYDADDHYPRGRPL